MAIGLLTRPPGAAEPVIVRAVETCCACPSQWNAWTADGTYLYLRYRGGIGSVSLTPGGEPVITFGSPSLDGSIYLDEFCDAAGLALGPQLTPHPGARAMATYRITLDDTFNTKIEVEGDNFRVGHDDHWLYVTRWTDDEDEPPMLVYAAPGTRVISIQQLDESGPTEGPMENDAKTYKVNIVGCTEERARTIAQEAVTSWSEIFSKSLRAGRKR